MPLSTSSQLANVHRLPALPGMFVRSLFTVARKDSPAAEASEMVATYTAPAFSAELLQRYQHAFAGFVSELPLSLMYCLAQRVHLAQMLDEQFPWPAPGLVHVSNELQQLAAIDLSEGFTMRAQIRLPARGPSVSVRRLRPLFSVDFYQGETCVARCVSEYQVRPKQSAPRNNKPKELKLGCAPGEDWQQLGRWRLHAATGRQYAKLSGDFNPIHLHPLLSRWFGFSQPIIHGMYMVARAQAEIERASGQSVQHLTVDFKRPVALPARVTLWQQLTVTGSIGSYQICGAEDQLQRLEGTFQLGP